MSLQQYTVSQISRRNKLASFCTRTSSWLSAIQYIYTYRICVHWKSCKLFGDLAR